jgi:hypothetical protein
VKEYMGRDEWAWEDFLKLPTENLSRWRTYWIYTLGGNSYFGSTAPNPPFDRRPPRDKQHAKILATPHSEILEGRKIDPTTNKRENTANLFIHERVTKEQELYN